MRLNLIFKNMKNRRKKKNTAKSRYANLGYLVWQKIPLVCFGDKNIRRLLETDNSNSRDEYVEIVERSKSEVMRTVDDLKARKIRLVRTGISWAEWVTPGGRQFVSWYIRKFAESGFKILPNLMFTPPNLGVRPAINSPPRNIGDYAVFVHDVCKTLGQFFEEVELWNEWNLNTDWDPEVDPEFVTFVQMISLASLIARHHHKKVVLGGMSGVREQSLLCFRKLVGQGLMAFIDVIGFHSLRGTWGDRTPAPPPLHIQADILSNEAMAIPDTITVLHHVSVIEQEAAKIGGEMREIVMSELGTIRVVQGIKRPAIWVTEYGFPTINTGTRLSNAYLEDIQAAIFADALTHIGENRLERIYWYTLRDLVSPSVRQLTTGREDHLQYYYGDTTEDGKPKVLGELLLESGPEGVLQYVADHNLWGLVESASLDRELPADYLSQDRLSK
jgi:CDP-paratose 2-epimerase